MPVVEFDEEGEFEWEVPEDITVVNVTVVGAETVRTAAASCTATIPVTPGQIFRMVNGGCPVLGNSSGGSNGGGYGESGSSQIDDASSVSPSNAPYPDPAGESLDWTTAGAGRTDLLLEDDLIIVAGGAPGETAALRDLSYWAGTGAPVDAEWYYLRGNRLGSNGFLWTTDLLTGGSPLTDPIIPGPSEDNRVPYDPSNPAHSYSGHGIAEDGNAGAEMQGGTSAEIGSTFGPDEDPDRFSTRWISGAGGGGYGGGAGNPVYFYSFTDNMVPIPGRMGTSYSSIPESSWGPSRDGDFSGDDAVARPGRVRFEYAGALSQIGWSVGRVGRMIGDLF